MTIQSRPNEANPEDRLVRNVVLFVKKTRARRRQTEGSSPRPNRGMPTPAMICVATTEIGTERTDDIKLASRTTRRDAIANGPTRNAPNSRLVNRVQDQR